MNLYWYLISNMNLNKIATGSDKIKLLYTKMNDFNIVCHKN